MQQQLPQLLSNEANINLPLSDEHRVCSRTIRSSTHEKKKGKKKKKKKERYLRTFARKPKYEIEREREEGREVTRVNPHGDKPRDNGTRLFHNATRKLRVQRYGRPDETMRL